MSQLILLWFFSVTLHESGTRNALLGPLPNNTEVYLIIFISTQIDTKQAKKLAKGLFFFLFLKARANIVYIF
jgi:hypothetical protein